MSAALEKEINAAPDGELVAPLSSALCALDQLLAIAVEKRGGSADSAQTLGTAVQGWPPGSVLHRELGLTQVDLAILLIALAPDIDLRYERIYAHLHDDAARRRPTLDLFANLLACDAEERLAVVGRLTATAPLRRAEILMTDHRAEPSHLARGWRVDTLWREWLCGIGDIDVGAAARFVPPRPAAKGELAFDSSTRALLTAALSRALDGRRSLRLLVHGPHGSGKLALTQSLAAALRLKVLTLDMGDVTTSSNARALIQRAHSAAILFGAILYVHGLARLEAREPHLLRAALDALAQTGCHLVLSASSELSLNTSHALPLVRIELCLPSVAQRREIWRREITERALSLPDDDAWRLADRFSLSAPQIRQAAAEVHERASLLGASKLEYDDLAAAVRAQCGSELARLAQRIKPRADFASLVAPDEVLSQLREICARIATREIVIREWGNDSVHARSQGVTALFAGPSGTGKTLAAEALARELALELYRIDLASIVSKYIGETEKNLDRVFTAAENANAVLFFDEADALFGKRSEVKEAHDRYANIEIAYLLQKMEQFEGLAILATNLKQNIDEAFARRLTFSLAFPFPEEPERRKLWEKLWPPRAPRAADVDLAWFAREFRMSGGNIRNSVLAAAHLAAADGKIITKAHLLHATRREFQKFGKTLAPASGDARSAR